MYELKKNGKVFMSKFVGTGPPSYEKRIYRAAVAQRLRNAGLEFFRGASEEISNYGLETTQTKIIFKKILH